MCLPELRVMGLDPFGKKKTVTSFLGADNGFCSFFYGVRPLSTPFLVADNYTDDE
jgi:hypothetical protein